MGSGLLQPRPRSWWHTGRSSPDRPSTFPPATWRAPAPRDRQPAAAAVPSGLNCSPRPGRGGAGRPGGRGGAVTRPRARAGGRALSGSRGAEAACRSAPLRSGCSGSRAGSAARDPADRTTSPSSLPAGPRFPEGTRSQEERSQLSQAGSKTMECVVPLNEHNQMNCTDHSLETSS